MREYRFSLCAADFILHTSPDHGPLSGPRAGRREVRTRIFRTEPY